jgi:hypothetical protein
MYWEITRDYLGVCDGILPSDGDEVGTMVGTPIGSERIAFKIYDDDGEHYYSGRCDAEAVKDDDNPEGLYGALQWAEWNAGATDLRVNGVSIYG